LYTKLNEAACSTPVEVREDKGELLYIHVLAANGGKMRSKNCTRYVESSCTEICSRLKKIQWAWDDVPPMHPPMDLVIPAENNWRTGRPQVEGTFFQVNHCMFWPFYHSFTLWHSAGTLGSLPGLSIGTDTRDLEWSWTA